MILVRHLDLKFLNELAAAMNRNFKSAALVAAGNGEVRNWHCQIPARPLSARTRRKLPRAERRASLTTGRHQFEMTAASTF
jgi:hypothetical protein